MVRVSLPQGRTLSSSKPSPCRTARSWRSAARDWRPLRSLVAEIPSRDHAARQRGQISVNFPQRGTDETQGARAIPPAVSALRLSIDTLHADKLCQPHPQILSAAKCGRISAQLSGVVRVSLGPRASKAPS